MKVSKTFEDSRLALKGCTQNSLLGGWEWDGSSSSPTSFQEHNKAQYTQWKMQKTNPFRQKSKNHHNNIAKCELGVEKLCNKVAKCEPFMERDLDTILPRGLRLILLCGKIV